MIEVNGIEKGKGSGPSKQLAKEDAARAAYFAMGWAPRTSGSFFFYGVFCSEKIQHKAGDVTFE